jgi:hypothetical protein
VTTNGTSVLLRGRDQEAEYGAGPPSCTAIPDSGRADLIVKDHFLKNVCHARAGGPVRLRSSRKLGAIGGERLKGA